MSPTHLDLNRPDDARAYVMSWIEDGEDAPMDLMLNGSENDFLLVARQLFLYCDPRPALGEEAH